MARQWLRILEHADGAFGSADHLTLAMDDNKHTNTLHTANQSDSFCLISLHAKAWTALNMS